MLFEMTHLDIKDGKKRNCAACPVALCIKRMVGAKLSCVSTCNVRLYADRPGDWEFHALPAYVTDWIHNFDNGKVMEPVSFELDIAA